jgi:hypothetical protein
MNAVRRHDQKQRCLGQQDVEVITDITGMSPQRRGDVNMPVAIQDKQP